MQRAELTRRLQENSDAIITFQTADFDNFATGPGRDYHLVFFLNAGHLASNPQMKLPVLRSQYSLMAKVGASMQAQTQHYFTVWLQTHLPLGS